MKKMRKILFSILAFLMVLQSTSTWAKAENENLNESTTENKVEEVVNEKDGKKLPLVIKPVEDLKNDEEKATNKETKEDVANDKNKTGLGDQEEPEESEEPEEPKEPEVDDVLLKLMSLQFTDYNGVLKSNAEVRTGDKTRGSFTYNLDANQSVDANSLAFRFTLPKGANVMIQTNVAYTTKFGSKDTPFEKVDTDTNNDYMWLIMNDAESTEESAATIHTIQFTVTPFAIGIPAQEEMSIPVDAFIIKDDNINSTRNSHTEKIYSYADKFDFNKNQDSIVSGNQSVNTESNEVLSDFRYSTKTVEKHSSNTKGLVFTKSVEFEDSFIVPLDKSGKPLIQFKKEDIKKQNDTDFSDEELTVTEKDGLVTGFTIKTTVLATEGQQLSGASSNFKIVKPKFDSEQVQKEFDLKDKDKKSFFITSTNRTAKATAVGPVSGKDSNIVDLEVNQEIKLGVTYTHNNESMDESYLQKFKNQVTEVAGINTINSSEDKLGVYQNEIIKVDFAESWKNLQLKPIPELKFTLHADESGEKGFNPNDLQVLSVNTGTLKLGNKVLEPNVKVKIYYEDGPIMGEELIPSENSETFKIDPAKQEKISKIEWVYEDIPAGAYFSSTPNVRYKVHEQDSATAQGKKITSSVDLEFDYDGENFKKTSDVAVVRYRDINLDQSGQYGTNKTGSNLSGKNFQTKGDVYLFEMKFENKTNDPIVIKSIKDFYTYNLSAYDGEFVSTQDDETVKFPKEYYANKENALNLKLWKKVDGKMELVEDQSIINDIKILEDETIEDNLLTITFKDEGITLGTLEEYSITYTMAVNELYIEDETILNKYEAFDKDNVVLMEGIWTSTKSIDRPTESRPSYSKLAYNASGMTALEQPFADDILIYTLQLENKSDKEIKNIKVEDTYSYNLIPYESLNNIPQKTIDDFGLVANASNMNLSVKLKDGELVMPEDFDVSQIKITRKDDNKSFVVSLGNNVLKEGDKLELIYTMQVSKDAKAKEQVLNEFKMFADDEFIHDGRHTWIINSQNYAKGILNTVHSVVSIEKDGETPNINRLINGDQLEFTINVSNVFPRANRIVKVKNVYGYLPEYIIYDDESVTLQTEIITQNPDGSTETEILDIPKDEYEIEYDAEKNILKAKFNNEHDLPGGMVGNNATHNIVMKYNATVKSDDDSFPTDKSKIEVESVAVAFYKENKEELIAKSGTLYDKKDDSEYNDNDEDTHTYVLNKTMKLTMLNQKVAYGYINTSVSNETQRIDLLHQKENNELYTRDYDVKLYNTGFKAYDADKFVGLFPDKETLNDEVKPKVHIEDENGNKKSFDAVYNVDTVKVDDKEVNRVTITGYVNEDDDIVIFNMKPMIKESDKSSISITFSSVIDANTASHEMYTNDIYSKKDTFRTAMYTNKPITLLKPNGISGGNAIEEHDDLENSNWDSDDNTETRYVSNVDVTSILSGIAPHIEVKPQIINSTESGEIYSDADLSTSLKPGSYVGWKLTVGNSRMDNTPEIKKGSIIALELADGLEFVSYKDDKLSDVFEEVESLNENIRVWKTTQDIKSNESHTLTIKTSTRSDYQEVYTTKGYFVPVDVVEYGFINSKIEDSVDYKNKSFQATKAIIPEELGQGSDPVSHVYTASSINVLGDTKIGGSFSMSVIEEPGKNTSTLVSNKSLTVSDIENTIRYTMTVDSEEVGMSIDRIMFINRLGGDNDRYVYRNQERRSQGKIKLVDDGDFEVLYVDKEDETLNRVLDSSEYTLEYATVAYDYNFKDKDWDSSNHEIWLSKEELLDSGATMNDVTATRVVLSEDTKLNKSEAINVSYTAVLDDYHMENWEVYNSFAYSLRLNGTIPYKVETSALGLKSKIKTDRLTVTTTVIDPAITPLDTNFEYDVVGYDKDTDEEVYRTTQSIEVSKDIEDYIHNLKLESLDRSLYYKVEAPIKEGYRDPVLVVNSSTDNYGLTTWNIELTYERIVYDLVEVDVEVISQDNTQKLNKVNYELEVTDENQEVETLINEITVKNNLGNDIIDNIETGNTLKLIPTELKGYKLSVEELEVLDLDTTGKHYRYKLVYEEEESSTENPNIKPPVVKPEEKHPGNTGSVITGIDSNALMYASILMIALAGLLVFIKTKKKK